MYIFTPKRMLKVAINMHINQGEWGDLLKVTQLIYGKVGSRQGLGQSFSSKLLMAAETRF